MTPEEQDRWKQIQTEQRICLLLVLAKSGRLTEEEEFELNQLMIEHLLAKARARQPGTEEPQK